LINILRYIDREAGIQVLQVNILSSFHCSRIAQVSIKYITSQSHIFRHVPHRLSDTKICQDVLGSSEDGIEGYCSVVL
jgi:hypothetical protein